MAVVRAGDNRQSTGHAACRTFAVHLGHPRGMGGLLIVALLHALDGTDEREDLGLLALEGTMAAQFLQRHIATTRGFERRLVCLCLKTRGCQDDEQGGDIAVHHLIHFLSEDGPRRLYAS